MVIPASFPRGHSLTRTSPHRICDAAHAASPPAVESEHGMVVTAQALATRVGVDILAHGGNAIDAAVAVGYAEAVVNPCCGNIGGGGFMLIHIAKTGRDVGDQFSRTRARRCDRLDVSRRNGTADRRREPRRLSRRGDAGHGARSRCRARRIWDVDAGASNGAGDCAGARRFHPDAARRRHHRRLGACASPAIPTRRAFFSAPTLASRCSQAMLIQRRSRRDAAGDRRQRTRRIL